MPSFRHVFREKYLSKPSVYKAWFGKKYFIWKGKALLQSVENMGKEIDRSLRLGLKDNDIYANVVHQIKYARISIMEIEVVCQSEDAVELLTCEHEQLQLAKTDSNCLNISFDQYLPKWIPEAAAQAFRQSLVKPKSKPRSSGKKAVKASGGKKGSSHIQTAQNPPLNKPHKASDKKIVPSKKLSSKGTKSSTHK